MRQILLRFVSLLVLIGPVCAQEAPARPAKSGIMKVYQSQGWLVQETPSFRVFCSPRLTEAPRLPEACEALRRQLHDTWLPEAAGDWAPRCDIVVHSSVAGYIRELGPESRQSSGCATIDIERGRVLKRRVDLRADADDWLTTALPHELTHVVLADKFSEQQIPRWVDEGIAILAEPAARQAARRKAMQQALERTPRFATAELMSLRNYPAGERRDAFYGQSASLVAWLIERESPARFLEFVQQGQRQGFDRALADVYQIASISELDARWRPRLLERGSSAELYAGRVARITAGRPID